MAASAETAEKTKGFDLFAAMASVDLNAPTPAGEGVYAPVAEGEKVLGVMGDELRRFNRVRRDMFDKCRVAEENIWQLAEVHEKKHRDGVEQDCPAFHRELDRLEENLALLKAQAKMINEFFWVLTEMKFGLTNADLGIREGAQIVSLSKRSKSAREDIAEMFAKLIVARL